MSIAVWEEQNAKITRLEAENARLRALCGEDKRLIDKFNQQLMQENGVLLSNSARLREELAEEKRLLAEESQQYEDLREEYDKACSDLTAAQKDAARYRWLRDEDSALEVIHEAALCLPNGEELDAAIDAAMKEQA